MPMTWTDQARAEVRILPSPFPPAQITPFNLPHDPHDHFRVPLSDPLQLLAHILRLHPIKLDYDALAEAMGPECTAKAVQRQILRMKNAGNGVAAVDDEPEATAEAQGPVTAKKRARKTDAISAMKGARRDAKGTSKAADDEDEEMYGGGGDADGQEE
ncbi:hypothetical protein MMC27_001454 [Xylographa pallens]|nr:hypothetical protein [Xylographa pallens]